MTNVAKAFFCSIAGLALFVACAQGATVDDSDGGILDPNACTPACSGATPICDATSHVCIGCSADKDCTAGRCDPKTHACVTTCASDSDCKDPMAKKCDQSTKTCAPCVQNPDSCNTGTYCAKDAMSGALSCKPGCKTTADCANVMFDAGAQDGGGPTSTPECCNHACVDTSADGMNCGKCQTACPMGNSCCSSSCLDTAGGVQNCGGCGNVCAPDNVVTAQCAMGACGYDACTMGFGDCDMVKSNGCETDVTSDKMNCGKCGMVCGNGQQCVASVCVTCTANEIAFGGHCYYLDGSGGVCDANYARAGEAILSQIKASFAGKNYKHTVSSNCCIWTSDVVENYGMTTHCNSNGPFSNGEPVAGGAGCTNVQNHNAGQLTFCGSN